MPKIKKKTGSTSRTPQEEIQHITHGASDLYDAYRQQINVALTLLVLVALIGVVYSFVRSGNEQKAGQILSLAYEAASPGGAAPANYPLALQRFQEAAAQYGGTVSGTIAQFNIGNTYMQMGQPESALKEYDAFVKKHDGEAFLLGLVYQRMGYAYLALGRNDDAVKAFGKAESFSGTGTATIELARLAERAGNAPEAQKRYKQISDQLPSTGWAAEARAKLPPPSLASPKPAAGDAGAK